jgi:hypothetical protein
MTEEDLIKEIERLKAEIQELKGKKGDREILKVLQWLNIGEAAVKAYRYMAKAGKAAEAGILSSGTIVTGAGVGNIPMYAPWVLLLLYVGKRIGYSG